MPTLVPSDVQVKNNPTLKVVDASRVGGGFQIVADVAALATIDASVKFSGMKVRTVNPPQEWVLLSNLTSWMPSAVNSDNGQASRALHAGDISAPRQLALDYTDTGFTVFDASWWRNYDTVSLVLHDELVWVATDNGSQHFLRTRINGVVSNLRTLTEPGRILIVGNYVYVIGQSTISDGVRTYTPPATKVFGGFGARINTLLGNEMPYDTIVVTSTNSTNLYSFNVGDASGQLSPLMAIPYNSSAVCSGGGFDFWVAASGGNLLNITFGSLEDSVITPVIRATLVLPETITSNLLFDGKYIWACSVNSLFRVSQDGFVSKISFPSSGTQKLSFDGLRVWLTAPSTNQLVAIDPESFRFVYNNFNPSIDFQGVVCIPDVDGRVYATAANGEIYLNRPNATTRLQLLGEQQGDILFRGANDWKLFPAGTAGKFFQTQGTGQDPLWSTVTADTIVGGLHIVADLTARNAISNTLREQGMLCWVQQAGSGVMYRLKASPWFGTNADWEVANTEIQRFNLVQASESTDLDGTSKQVVGAAYFEPIARVPQTDPRTRTVLLTALIETTTASSAANLDIYDVSVPAVVSGSPISTVNQTITQITTDLTSALGGVFTSRILEARIWLTTTSAPNFATCKCAYIDLIFT